MATASHPKETTFNFRVDPGLKAAFTEAAEADHKPAAEVLRRFMRSFVRRSKAAKRFRIGSSPPVTRDRGARRRPKVGRACGHEGTGRRTGR
jgi:hypothetical protein